MRDFSDGIRQGENEDDYQAALQESPDSLVISLSRSRKGQFTLHSTKCGTLSYDLSAKGQSTRSGKIIFRDENELNEWRATRPNLQFADLNRCSRCL
jgi:hypothetical protein